MEAIIKNLPIIFRGNINELNEYKSVQIAYFKLNGIVLSETTTKCNISQTILARESNGSIVIEYIISKLQNEGGLDNLLDVVNFLNKIESVTQKLVLGINTVGDVEKIFNQSEILNNWINLKQELQTDPIFKNMTTENQKLIISQGDFEYDEKYPYHEGIKNSLIFYNLIFPFYGFNLSNDNRHESFKSQRHSSIIKQVKIPLDNDAIYYESNNSEKEIRVQSRCEKNMDLSVLEIDLKKNYKDFPGQIKSYSYNISHTYELENNTNKIISSKIVLQEKIDDAFEVNIEHTINLISNE